MTSFAEIAILAINNFTDDSLIYDLQNRTPLFYSRMTDLILLGIPKFSHPPEMIVKLGNRTEGDFAEYKYPVEAKIESGDTIETDLPGYDIVSCGLIKEDATGVPYYVPLLCEYDSETGIITAGQNVEKGEEIVVDFYKDTVFEEDLNDTEKGILAYATYAAWEQKFDNNAIERMAKIRDSSFSTISEASNTNAATNRLKQVELHLNASIKQYEQGGDYLAVVKNFKLF